MSTNLDHFSTDDLVAETRRRLHEIVDELAPLKLVALMRAAVEQADDDWADPDWSVDSRTRSCCGGIGRHAVECAADDD